MIPEGFSHVTIFLVAMCLSIVVFSDETPHRVTTTPATSDMHEVESAFGGFSYKKGDLNGCYKASEEHYLANGFKKFHVFEDPQELEVINKDNKHAELHGWIRKTTLWVTKGVSPFAFIQHQHNKLRKNGTCVLQYHRILRSALPGLIDKVNNRKEALGANAI